MNCKSQDKSYCDSCNRYENCEDSCNCRCLDSLKQIYLGMIKEEWGAFQDGQIMTFNEWIEYELYNAKRFFIDDDDPQMEEWIYQLENNLEAVQK